MSNSKKITRQHILDVIRKSEKDKELISEYAHGKITKEELDLKRKQLFDIA